MLRLTSFRNRLLAGLSLSIAVAAVSGCQILVGLGGEESKGTGGTTSTGGSGGATGGTTNPGGGGTGGLAGTCTPSETRPCYSGPDGTIGVGECKGGTATCRGDGTWGTCEGEVPPAIELCSAPKDENCDKLDCIVFVKSFTDVEGRAVAVDPKGNIFAAVTFSAGVDFGDGDAQVPTGANDIAILEYDKSGTLLAKRVFPASGFQTVGDIVIAADGSLAIGGTTDSPIDFGFGSIGPGAYIAKLDSAMSPVWAKAATGQYINIDQLAFDAMGNVFAAADGSSVDFGNGALSVAAETENFWVAKLGSANGALAWRKMTKGAGAQSLGGIAVDKSNSLVITGINSAQYLSLTDGTVVNDVYNGTGQKAPFLVRLDPAGNYSDGKTLVSGSALNVSVAGLSVDKLGVSTIVGSFSGAISFSKDDFDAGADRALFLMHDQTSGFQQTVTAFVQPGVYVNPKGMGVDTANDVVMHGNMDGPLDLGNGPLVGSQFIAKLGADGGYRWARTYNIGDGQFRDLAVGTLEDETVVIGIYYGVTNLGSGFVLTGNGMFLMKLGK